MDLIKEVRLEQSKARKNAKIIDKKGIIWGGRSTFQDMMKVRCAAEEIKVCNSRCE